MLCRRAGLPVRDHADGGLGHPTGRHTGDEGPNPCRGDERRHHHRAGLHRTRVRVRRRGGDHEGRARRRRVDHQRLQDVHNQRTHRRLRLPAGPNEPREAEAQGPHHVPRSADAPGFEAQAVWTLSGERTNITFYSDVRVGDEWRIGDVDEGWQVLGISLQDEHASGWGPHLVATAAPRRAMGQNTAADARARHASPTADVRRRIARVAIEAEVSMLLQRRCVWMTEQGPGPRGRRADVQAVQHRSSGARQPRTSTNLVGADALRSYFEPTAPQQGPASNTCMRFSLGTTIYAGTSEVQRTIIAQRGLGLPR